MSKNVEKQSNNANKSGKKLKKNVLDYGMEWFDYHLTVGIYISVVIASLWFVFLFIGQPYREDLLNTFPEVKMLDTIMIVYYAIYTVLVFFTRKIFLAEDRRSFGMFMVLFLIRALFHAFTTAYFLVINPDVIAGGSIFYEYYTYFAIVVAVVNVFNLFYFYR